VGNNTHIRQGNRHKLTKLQTLSISWKYYSQHTTMADKCCLHYESCVTHSRHLPCFREGAAGGRVRRECCRGECRRSWGGLLAQSTHAIHNTSKKSLISSKSHCQIMSFCKVPQIEAKIQLKPAPMAQRNLHDRQLAVYDSAFFALS
jgi:hypothetical protein